MQKIIHIILLILTLTIKFSRNASLSAHEQKKYQHTLDGQGLYSAQDDVEVLTINNFVNSITNSPQAYLVEFYNSWCGFCQRFAPSWKALATDVKGWRDLIRIAAFDCSNDDNFPICREYEIMSYPTLKYFHEFYQPNSANLGSGVSKGDDVTSHRHYLIDKLIEEQQAGRARNLPNLLPFTQNTITSNATIQYQFFIVGENSQYHAAEVAMDLHKTPNISIRSLNNSAPIRNLNIGKMPAIIVVDNQSNRPESITSPANSREVIRQAIVDYLTSRQVKVTDDTVKNADIFRGKWLEAEVPDMGALIQERARQVLKERVKKMGDVVFQMDLETALRYSLKHEVGVLKNINGEKLAALLGYLTVLQKYFPFGQAGQMFLTDLVGLVSGVDQIEGELINRAIVDAEKEERQVFSSPPQWLACKGSTQSFRGYPCGLWKLFHYLTVNAADVNSVKSNSGNPREVLEAMLGYVKNFFGCADCSQHFQEMAVKNDMRNVSSWDSSIIWLWLAHNQVNRRLAGDPTEDPEFPKIQFPSKERCPQCYHTNNNTWNLMESLKYVKHVYSSLNVRYIGSDTRILHVGLSGGEDMNLAMGSTGNGSIFKTLDMSMCFVLYVCSFLLLALLIRMFLKRGYRKKPYVHDLLGKV